MSINDVIIIAPNNLLLDTCTIVFPSTLQRFHPPRNVSVCNCVPLQIVTFIIFKLTGHPTMTLMYVEYEMVIKHILCIFYYHFVYHSSWYEAKIALAIEDFA